MTAPVPGDAAPVRAGEDLDWRALEMYMRANIPDLAGDCQVLQFPNGSANLTYFVRFGDQSFVVRRPPFGQIAPGAHDMRREYRALSQLWRTYDRAPRAYLFCDDHSVIGSDFVVIEYRTGRVIWTEMPPEMAVHPDAGRRVGLAVVDALAELHLVDPGAAGLDGLGRPDGFVERQLAGWTKRWELAAAPDAEPLMTVVGDRLAAAMPVPARAAVLHNDFKLDNCQFDHGVPDRVKSIFDWDMATLGDPFIDLGILLNYWPDLSDGDGNRPLYADGVETLGLPTRAEVVERYAAVTGFDVGDVYWYEAFACWKSAVVLQQLYIRYVRGESADERMADRPERVSPQAQRAMLILDEAGCG